MISIFNFLFWTFLLDFNLKIISSFFVRHSSQQRQIQMLNKTWLILVAISNLTEWTSSVKNQRWAFFGCWRIFPFLIRFHFVYLYVLSHTIWHNLIKSFFFVTSFFPSLFVCLSVSLLQIFFYSIFSHQLSSKMKERQRVCEIVIFLWRWFD